MSNPDIVRELQTIRRGRGLHANDLHQRIGPRLRLASNITDTDSPAAVRRKLTLRLAELCNLLPPDLQLAALVAFSLHKDADGRFLEDRVAWLAAYTQYTSKTVRRRIDAAFRLISEHMDQQPNPVDPSDYTPGGWYLASVRASVRIDVDPPRLVEDRTIVATVDDLEEITAALAATPRSIEGTTEESGRITAEMIYGGEVVERRDPSSGYARFMVRLPEPLQLGQRHEYGIQFTTYPRSLLRPYYVVTSLRRCDHFTARVRFGRDHMPGAVWRINGVPPRVLDDFVPPYEPITIDRVGDVSVEFHELKIGLSYGVKWKD